MNEIARRFGCAGQGVKTQLIHLWPLRRLFVFHVNQLFPGIRKPRKRFLTAREPNAVTGEVSDAIIVVSF